MNKTFRILSCALVCTLLLGVCAPAFAAGTPRDVSFETKLADGLKLMRIFKGVSDTDYALEKPANRAEMAAVLVRLLGKEKEAAKKSVSSPFRDVPKWAAGYVGIAYKYRVLRGVSAKRFDPDGEVTSAMYLTGVLRVLGYSDADGDFDRNDPQTLARSAGILPKQVQCDNFVRADMVSVSYAALQAKHKDMDKTLADLLVVQRVFDSVMYTAVIDKLVFRQWSEFSRESPAEAIEAITGREGFVLEQTLPILDGGGDFEPAGGTVIYGKMNGKPELYMVYGIKVPGRVQQLPLMPATEDTLAEPENLQWFMVHV